MCTVYIYIYMCVCTTYIYILDTRWSSMGWRGTCFTFAWNSFLLPFWYGKASFFELGMFSSDSFLGMSIYVYIYIYKDAPMLASKDSPIKKGSTNKSSTTDPGRSPFDQPLPKPSSDYLSSILRDAAHAEEQRPQFVHSCSPNKVALLTINSHLRVLCRDNMTLTSKWTWASKAAKAKAMCLTKWTELTPAQIQIWMKNVRYRVRKVFWAHSVLFVRPLWISAALPAGYPVSRMHLKMFPLWRHASLGCGKLAPSSFFYLDSDHMTWGGLIWRG